MRQLLYIPIIHDEADLGSPGPDLAHSSAALAGERRWAMHRETVRRFWEMVRGYLSGYDARKMRVYQDGLAADGAVGKRIVEEGARRGSRNYQIVLELVANGAHLQATEHVALLLREHAQATAEGRPAPSPEQRERLLEERDTYIADVIGATLQEEELGVLFIGAVHNVLGRLATDIRVQTSKDPDKLRAYIHELLLGNDSRRLETLARYVAAPVDTS
ncbi:MAG: hypothetical protein Q8O40_14275 [Chloroflexota bacterium]|nr:hypothetical protein [Chloroflexota bacterium]